VAYQRQVVRETTERGGRRFERFRKPEKGELYPAPLAVRFDDLLAVCVLSLRRR
jgi:hypothetical protein